MSETATFYMNCLESIIGVMMLSSRDIYSDSILKPFAKRIVLSSDLYGQIYAHICPKVIHKAIGHFVQYRYDEYVMIANYSEMTRNQMESVLGQLDSHEGLFHIEIDKIKMMSKPLLFTKGWKKIICSDYSTVPFKDYWFLENKLGSVFPVLYTPQPFEDNNFSSMDITLTAETLEDYLILFFHAFQTDYGTMIPVRHVDDIDWNEELSPITRKSLEKEIQSYPRIEESGSAFSCKLACLYHSSLIEIELSVTKSGHVTVQTIKSLQDDLPVKNFS